MPAKKIIARIQGGLGNQLFCYASARRMALVNNAELIIDDITGFSRDRLHKRQYALDHFQIPVRKATAAERMEPFERFRRGIAKFRSRQRPFHERKYIEQEGIDFDPRVLKIIPEGTVYLDGLWQGEGYFKDAEEIIKEDLRIIPPRDSDNLEMMEKILSVNSVCVHYRWFDSPDSASVHNLHQSYYRVALKLIMEKVTNPHFFLFSDDPEKALKMSVLPHSVTTCVRNNFGDESAYADLWLMTHCKHFIIANSTFSWWGAWLGGSDDKVTLAPGITSLKSYTAWGFRGLLPESWILVK